MVDMWRGVTVSVSGCVGAVWSVAAWYGEVSVNVSVCDGLW